MSSLVLVSGNFGVYIVFTVCCLFFFGRLVCQLSSLYFGKCDV